MSLAKEDMCASVRVRRYLQDLVSIFDKILVLLFEPRQFPPGSSALAQHDSDKRMELTAVKRFGVVLTRTLPSGEVGWNMTPPRRSATRALARHEMDRRTRLNSVVLIIGKPTGRSARCRACKPSRPRRSWHAPHHFKPSFACHDAPVEVTR
jgi:hypothetical protein